MPVSSPPPEPSASPAPSVSPIWRRLALLLGLIALGTIIWGVRTQIELRSHTSILQSQALEIRMLQSSLTTESTISVATLERLRSAPQGSLFTHHGKLERTSAATPRPAVFLLWAESTGAGFLYSPSGRSGWDPSGLRIHAFSELLPHGFEMKMDQTGNATVVGILPADAPRPINRLELRSFPEGNLIGTITLREIGIN